MEHGDGSKGVMVQGLGWQTLGHTSPTVFSIGCLQHTKVMEGGGGRHGGKYDGIPESNHYIILAVVTTPLTKVAIRNFLKAGFPRKTDLY